jgi:hypothetical protein
MLVQNPKRLESENFTVRADFFCQGNSKPANVRADVEYVIALFFSTGGEKEWPVPAQAKQPRNFRIFSFFASPSQPFRAHHGYVLSLFLRKGPPSACEWIQPTIFFPPGSSQRTSRFHVFASNVSI